MMYTNRYFDLMPSMLNAMLNNWNAMAAEPASTMPKMNVTESEKEYCLEMCVPGSKKEDLKITIDNANNMIVKLSHEKSVVPECRRLLRREFAPMEFTRTIALPEDVKPEAVSAKMEDGILTICLPKMGEQEKVDALQTIRID